MGITFEDLEHVKLEYLKDLSLDVVQNRLESSADEMHPREIKAFVEFIDKRESAEPEPEPETDAKGQSLEDFMNDTNTDTEQETD